MPVHPNFNPDYLYFVTSTAVEHFHLFQQDSIKRVLVDSLHFLHTKRRMNLYVFVIMPNHIHFIARFSKEYRLSDGLRDFKRHTARRILRELCAQRATHTLTLLRQTVNDPGQEYKVWEAGYDARDICSVKFLQQKMDYIHWNPCQLKWKLTSVPEDYLWSSARFYVAGKSTIIPIDDARSLFV